MVFSIVDRKIVWVIRSEKNKADIYESILKALIRKYQSATNISI